MRWVALVVLACGCDRVLGLHATIAADAQFHDAPIDAPFVCPTTGAPTYNAQLTPTETTSCYDFTFSPLANRVIGTCPFGTATAQVAEGGLAGALSPIAGFAPDGVHTYDLPHLAPSGDELFVRVTANAVSHVQRYTRAGDGTWSFAAVVNFAGLAITDLSAPSAGGNGRRIIVRDGTNSLFELEDAGGDQWQLAGTYTTTDLAIAFPPVFLTLTDDGLRAVFQLSSFPPNSDWIYITTRATVTDRFSPAQTVPTAPMFFPKFLESGCGRLYVAHDEYLEYVEQP